MPTIDIAIKANVAGTFQNCANITYNHPPGDNWMGDNNFCVPFVVGGDTQVAHDVNISKTVGSGPLGSAVTWCSRCIQGTPGQGRFRLALTM